MFRKKELGEKLYRMKEVKPISRESFEKYGYVIGFPEECSDIYYVVTSEEKEPWRIAVFRFSDREIRRLECHPASMESFEPIKGIAVLAVAEHDHPEEYEVFILERPVCLKKGIWHQVLSLTGETQVKITENDAISSVFYELDKPVKILAGQEAIK